MFGSCFYLNIILNQEKFGIFADRRFIKTVIELTMRKTKTFILLLLLVFCFPVFSYVGPGAGFAFVGSFFFIFIAFFLAFFNFLTFPVRIFFKFIKRVKSYLEGLSERTGGRSYDVLTLEDAKRAYREIVAELGYLINLSYYPIPEAKKGEKRSITVKVKVPNTAVRHRPWVVY